MLFNQFLKKHSLFIACFVVFCFKILPAQQKSIPVTLIYQSPQVLIESVRTICKDDAQAIHQEELHLKIQNKTNAPIEVVFQPELYYDGKCYTCEANVPEFVQTIQLKPFEILAGSCGQKQLAYFAKFLNKKREELTQFELKLFSVTPLN